MNYLVVPCGAAKGPRPAPAAQLYTSPHFQYVLRGATAEATRTAGRVLIMSALHGLITPCQVIAPYDVTISDPTAITPDQVATQAAAHGITFGADVYALLPRAYFTLLDTALRTLDVYAQNVYETARGIGAQRGIVARLINHTEAAACT